jgi:hypothetical protein
MGAEVIMSLAAQYVSTYALFADSATDLAYTNAEQIWYKSQEVQAQRWHALPCPGVRPAWLACHAGLSVTSMFGRHAGTHDRPRGSARGQTPLPSTAGDVARSRSCASRHRREARRTFWLTVRRSYAPSPCCSLLQQPASARGLYISCGRAPPASAAYGQAAMAGAIAMWSAVLRLPLLGSRLQEAGAIRGAQRHGMSKLLSIAQDRLL